MNGPPRIASVNSKNGIRYLHLNSTTSPTPTSGGLGPLAFNSAYPATATASG
jgi:hypothetical protein